jgi:hypothetical protein
MSARAHAESLVNGLPIISAAGASYFRDRDLEYDRVGTVVLQANAAITDTLLDEQLGSTVRLGITSTAVGRSGALRRMGLMNPSEIDERAAQKMKDARPVVFPGCRDRYTRGYTGRVVGP